MSEKRQAAPVLQVGSTRVVAASETAFGKPGRALVSLRYNVSSTGSRNGRRIVSNQAESLEGSFSAVSSNISIKRSVK